MSELPSSLLTGLQREVLAGERDPSYEKKMAQRIRDRVYAGLRTDFSLLLRHLDDKERRKIFRAWEKSLQDEEIDRVADDIAHPEQFFDEEFPEGPKDLTTLEKRYLQRGISDLLAFVYLGVQEGNVGNFEDLLEAAFSKAARESGRNLDDFDLRVSMSKSETRALTPLEIAERVRNGDKDLYLKDVMWAYKKGHLTQDEIETYLDPLGLEDINLE